MKYSGARICLFCIFRIDSSSEMRKPLCTFRRGTETFRHGHEPEADRESDEEIIDIISKSISTTWSDILDIIVDIKRHYRHLCVLWSKFEFNACDYCYRTRLLQNETITELLLVDVVMCVVPGVYLAYILLVSNSNFFGGSSDCFLRWLHPPYP